MRTLTFLTLAAGAATSTPKLGGDTLSTSIRRSARRWSASRITVLVLSGSMAKLLSKAFARMAAAGMAILGVWILTISLQEGQGITPAYILILASSAMGAIGGTIFLLSLDGPHWLRTRWARGVGWSGMLILGVLPWSLWMLAFGAVILTIPTLLMEPDPTKKKLSHKGQTFTVTKAGKEIRVSKSLDNHVNIELVSSSEDEETLVQMASDLARPRSRAAS